MRTRHCFRSGPRRWAAGASALALPAALLALAPPAAAQPALPDQCEPQSGQVVCTYDTPDEHTFQVPDGVTEVTFEVYGAQGGDAHNATGGLAGSATATMELGSGETVRVTVGGHGGNAQLSGGGPGGAGGYNGGAPGGDTGNPVLDGGGGGGASDVRVSPYGLDERIIVAGGGGGSAPNFGGGDGGGRTGEAGSADPHSVGGGGGTQDGAGAGGSLPDTPYVVDGNDGDLGVGGAGASKQDDDGGGGGGGGYYGGGGGAAMIPAGGGGGGSGFIHPDATNDSFQTGGHEGDGLVIITYTPPATDADLTIAKECTPGTVAPGEQVSCTVTVTNNGPADATGVTVSDQIGQALTLTGTPSGGGFSCDEAISCTREQLPAGESAAFSYTATTAADLGAEVQIAKTATVAAESPEDPQQANNTATATVATPTCTIDARDAAWAQAITGTPADDVICGSPHSDGIRAGDGDDIVFGGGGHDGVNGGAGNDRLYGGPGYDGLSGGAGDDALYGGPGFDGLSGGPGTDALDGGASYDGCNPAPGNDPAPVNCP